MSQALPKRLIEVDLPIKRISAHARREKSIRHGHISTLHIWWARRPLAACRAVTCAALWPDPVDENCPTEFRAVAADLMFKWGRDNAARGSEESAPTWTTIRNHTSAFALCNHPTTLRQALLDFIADFANWDNSTVSEYLETARALTAASHWALNLPVPSEYRFLGWPGAERWHEKMESYFQQAFAHPRPLAADPFAGGGSIPLEALRVGADSVGSDLNPVAVLLNKVLLEHIPKSKLRLAEEIRKWGDWVKAEAEKKLSAFYPIDSDGATPIAYMWARTIQCEGPGCGALVPLIRSMWLAKKQNRSIALRFIVDANKKTIDFDIITKGAKGWMEYGNNRQLNEAPEFEGTVKRGAVTCPCCGYTTPAGQMRKQLKTRHGGTKDSRLICVVTTSEKAVGRSYRLPTKRDCEALISVSAELKKHEASTLDPLEKIPNEPTPEGKGKGAGRAFSQQNYGMMTFADVYTDRQALTLITLAGIIRRSVSSEMPNEIRILCAFALGRVNDLSMSLCRWLTSLEAIAAANGGQNRMPVVLDYVESNPFGGSGGDWLGQIDWIARVVEHLQSSRLNSGNATRSPAQSPCLPSDSVDAFITDPPYYDAFPYSDLSDFFFIWLKRCLGTDVMAYTGNLVPKDDEAVVYDVAHGGETIKDRTFFQAAMTEVFTNWRRATKPSGVGVVVFANKTTEGWESLIQSIIDGGWIATASWPIDTERPNRQRAIDSAALGSSVHVVCRPREDADGKVRVDEVGDWRDILDELPRRIHDWMPRLASEGVVGADAIFACLGPALEIFSRYSRVEKASGEQVTLREYLEHIWAAVSKEALSSLISGSDLSTLEADARITAMWLWTLNSGATGTDADDDGEGEDAADEEEGGGKTAQGKWTSSGARPTRGDLARVQIHRPAREGQQIEGRRSRPRDF